MKTAYKWTSLLGVVLFAVGAGGCGGGGASTPSGPPGRVVLQVQFPPHPAHAVSRVIPKAANSIRIRITDPVSGVDLAQPQLIPRPTTPGPVTVEFDLIPAGPIRVVAAAYSDYAGTVELAAGSTVGQVTGGEQTDITVLLVMSVSLDFTDVTLSAAAAHAVRQSAPQALLDPRVTPPNSTVVHATVLDPANNPMPGFTVNWQTADPSVAALTVSPTDANTVQISGVAAGDTVVTATEPSSGMFARVTVHVQ